jgi:hypothetical protein
MHHKSSKAFRRTAVILGVLILLTRVYGACIPWGASPIPFTMARIEGPVLSSPDGTRHIHVYFNDAGGAHSGNHWTWFVERHFLIGDIVVTEGYLGADVAVSGAPIPLTWGSDNMVSVSFLQSRYGNIPDARP